MPRPKRCRRICQEPRFAEFIPQNGGDTKKVVLTVDEYEVIRLVDYEKKTHDQCARQMGISRTTVTEIYEEARFKLADCLVNGLSLMISGGNYSLCDGTAAECGRRNCHRRISQEPAAVLIEKGERTMRIAVTYENGQVFQHFGHTEQFKIYDVTEGKITGEQVVDTNGSGHGALGGFLAANQVDALICGGIGGGARIALADAGIQLYPGVSGEADAAVKAYLENRLSYNPDTVCSHHHGEEHNCGEHHCGEDKQGCGGNH